MAYKSVDMFSGAEGRRFESYWAHQTHPPSDFVFDMLTAIASRWDNPTMIVTLDSKRRLTLPSALMPARPGQVFDARFDAEEDAIIFRRLPGSEDWLEVLAECPVPMDDLPPRRRQLPKRRKL